MSSSQVKHMAQTDTPDAHANDVASPSSIIIEKVAPEMLIGVSAKNRRPTEEEERFCAERFAAASAKKCELCGASITEQMRHTATIGRAAYNTCGMCYCAMNLDRIPHYQRGSMIYFPNLSQPRLNALLRAVWSVDFMLDLSPKDKELINLHEMMNEMGVVFESQVMLTTGYMGTSSAEIYASMMFLLREHEYEQRFKMFKNIRWLPDRVIFEDEIAYWAQMDSHLLHPEKMAGNITQFMSKYVPSFSLKK